MLVELYSPVFREQGQIRSKMVFKNGLNVVLGKEDGENFIGKSSAMLAIVLHSAVTHTSPVMALNIWETTVSSLHMNLMGKDIILPAIRKHWMPCMSVPAIMI